MNFQDSPFPIPLAIAVPQTFPDGDIDLGMIRSYASRSEGVGIPQPVGGGAVGRLDADAGACHVPELPGVRD